MRRCTFDARNTIGIVSPRIPSTLHNIYTKYVMFEKDWKRSMCTKWRLLKKLEEVGGRRGGRLERRSGDKVRARVVARVQQRDQFLEDMFAPSAGQSTTRLVDHIEVKRRLAIFNADATKPWRGSSVLLAVETPVLDGCGSTSAQLIEVPIDTCRGKPYFHVQTGRTNKRFTSNLVITAFLFKKIKMWRGDSDAQRHSQLHRRAGGDSVAAELFLATHQAAERKATEEKDQFWIISGDFITITLILAVRFTCPANRRSRRF